MSSAPDLRDVHGVADEATGERGIDLLGGLHAGAVLGLSRGGTEVRRDDDVVQLEQRRLGHRLAREHVERGAGDLAGLQCVVAARRSRSARRGRR